MRVSKAFWIWCQFANDDMKFLKVLQSELFEYFKSPFFEIHLTLHGPIVDKKELDIEKILELKNKFTSFEIEALNYAISNNIYTSLFIDIAKTNNLTLLKKYLNKEIFIQNQTSFKPHISLIYGDFNENKKKNIIKSLPKIKGKKFKIKNLAIADVNENTNKWNIIEKIYFKN